MINSTTLETLEKLGFGSDVDALESYVASLQDAAGMGNPLVDDAVYDAHVKLLKELKPTSAVLNRNWETSDEDLTEYDEVLKKYGMCSINTIGDMSELGKFADTIADLGHPIDLMASIKDNGHGVRAVYLNGTLYSGSTRGRYKKGRDITRHIKAVLPPYVDAWAEIPIVEVRGEMLVSIENFEKYLKGKLKTPLSSVTSLIRDSVTDEELKLLEMECYKVISADGSLEFDTLQDEFKHLGENGFNTPPYGVVRGVTVENLVSSVEMALHSFESLMDQGKIRFSCDGIVFAINNNHDFYSTGKEGNAWNGNFALKTGKYWQQNVYSAVIREIQFIPGKSFITPKAIIDPVVTANGAEVTNVPLYNIGVMERYRYIPGETIYFRFGGEQGVTLCDCYGNSVSVTAQ